MTDRSHCIDADGHSCVAYGEDHPYVAFHDGPIWRCGVVDSSCTVGKFAALCLAASGLLRIRDDDGTMYDLKYARLVGVSAGEDQVYSLGMLDDRHSSHDLSL